MRSLVLGSLVLAAAAAVLPRQRPTALTSAAISHFTPYSYLAAAAYCDPSDTASWSCGLNCDAVPGFITTASGGDGDAVQFWYVGYYPALKQVVVAHQGTDPVAFLSDLTDIEFVPTPLSPTLFPGAPSGVVAHTGFQNVHAITAPDVLAAVNATLAAQNATQVAVVGHSLGTLPMRCDDPPDGFLGAAIALLDGMFLTLNLPKTVTVSVQGYGLPRVGNPAFANWVDQLLPKLFHVNHQQDPIPTVPFISMGFAHPHGEIHIDDNDNWESCPGHDNPSPDCTVGSVPNLLVSNILDHLGPYDGVLMGLCDI